mmetsp:Transcript_5626/g.20260  ORF Transcript_5626/g.20260 Transcript_5626/m.20260 type:complete len:328 (+) Transcript_5626:1110-2093(+)
MRYFCLAWEKHTTLPSNLSWPRTTLTCLPLRSARGALGLGGACGLGPPPLGGAAGGSAGPSAGGMVFFTHLVLCLSSTTESTLPSSNCSLCSPEPWLYPITVPLKYLCSSGLHTLRRQPTASLPWGLSERSSSLCAASAAARALAASSAFLAAISFALSALALAISTLSTILLLLHGFASATSTSSTGRSLRAPPLCCRRLCCPPHSLFPSNSSYSGVLGHCTEPLSESLDSLPLLCEAPSPKAPDEVPSAVVVSALEHSAAELVVGVSCLRFLDSAASLSSLQSAATLFPLGRVLAEAGGLWCCCSLPLLLAAGFLLFPLGCCCRC